MFQVRHRMETIDRDLILTSKAVIGFIFDSSSVEQKLPLHAKIENLSLFCHTQKLLQRAAIDIGGRAFLGKSCKAVPTPAQEQDDAVVFD